MSPVTYQTIKLGKGKHVSAEEGACVMELASMLAGEPFSDHPASVCPVIGSFLRAYNDSIDDRRRQDLYAYAARAVGTRAGIAVQRERADRLSDWAVDDAAAPLDAAAAAVAAADRRAAPAPLHARARDLGGPRDLQAHATRRTARCSGCSTG